MPIYDVEYHWMNRGVLIVEAESEKEAREFVERLEGEALVSGLLNEYSFSGVLSVDEAFDQDETPDHVATSERTPDDEPT